MTKEIQLNLCMIQQDLFWETEHFFRNIADDVQEKTIFLLMRNINPLTQIWDIKFLTGQVREAIVQSFSDELIPPVNHRAIL